MSITSDIRSYADTAVSQGKQVLETAQAQLNDVSGTANDAFGKYRANVSDIADKAVGATSELRSSVEKAINIDAVKAAIEPLLAQAKSYGAQVSDRAEDLLSGITSDKRVAKLVDTATSVSGAVAETVQDRVVKPVVSLTGLGAKPATKKPATKKPVAKKPVVTKPVVTKPTATTSATPSPREAVSTTATPTTVKPATKATARKSPADNDTQA